MEIFVAVYVLTEETLYFIPGMWVEGRNENLLSGMFLLMISLLPEMMV